MNRRRCAVVGILWAVCMTTAVGLIALLTPGCAQNQEQPTRTESSQVTPTTTLTDQNQNARGNVITIDTSNLRGTAPGLKEILSAASQPAGDEGETSFASTADGLTASSPGKLVLNNNTYITINNGGTTPSVTGTTTGTGTGTQTASATPTQSGSQEPRSSAQANIPVAAAPGSYASAQGGVAAGEGSQSGDQSAATTADLKTALVKAGADPTIVDKLMPFLQSLLGLQPAQTTTAPTVTPVTTQAADGGL